MPTGTEPFNENELEALEYFMKHYSSQTELSKMFGVTIKRAIRIWEHGKELLRLKAKDKKRLDNIVLSAEENELVGLSMSEVFRNEA